MKDVYDILAARGRQRGQKFALATLVRAEGSSYRRPGARMSITSDGRCTGSLSGGCLEEEVALHAREVLTAGEPRNVVFDTRLRFGCNGRIQIFIEPLPDQFLSQLSARLEARQSCKIATTYQGLSATLGSAIVESNDPVSDQDVFVHSVHPRIRVWIVGDGPDTTPVCRFCEILGWETFKVSSAESLPDRADEWTAAIVKTHNYGRDFASLQKLLPLNLRYVGLIGPRKRRDQILHNLLESGISINAGFFGPAGLDLNAETPEEIALAMVSEIQRVFAHGTGESLRERKVPIHLGKPGLAAKAPLEWETLAP